jgi:hypothetical protein
MIFHATQNKIPLPRKAPKNLESGYAAGWGLTEYTLQQTPKQFQKANLVVLTSLHCSQVSQFVVNNGQICAYRQNGVNPVCFIISILIQFLA